MENVLSLLATLKDSEIDTAMTFLKNHKKKTREIEKRVEKYCKSLRDRGLDEMEIESSRICKLRVMGIIDMDEALRRLNELYKHEQK
jgi:hypothetical protein